MIQIAIVEDITRIAEALKAKILLSPDFKLKFSAANGQEIIKLLERDHNVDVIIMDINMPVMNGWEFLEEFVPAYAEKLPGTKIIILSSTIDPQDFEQAKKFPVVVDFFSKPLGLEMLESLKESEHFRVYFAGSDDDDNKVCEK